MSRLRRLSARSLSRSALDARLMHLTYVNFYVYYMNIVDILLLFRIFIVRAMCNS